MKVNGGRGDVKVPEQMASPGDARSIAALFLAAGARPDEIDGAVQVLIELVKGQEGPRTYQAVAEQPIKALQEYRKRLHDSIDEPIILRNGAPA
jgi:hypothetical protein